MKWSEIVALITLPGAAAGVLLGFLFLASSCEIRNEEEETKRHNATESLKAELAELGFDARSIRCITKPRANDLLCVKLEPVP